MYILSCSVICTIFLAFLNQVFVKKLFFIIILSKNSFTDILETLVINNLLLISYIYITQLNKPINISSNAFWISFFYIELYRYKKFLKLKTIMFLYKFYIY